MLPGGPGVGVAPPPPRPPGPPSRPAGGAGRGEGVEINAAVAAANDACELWAGCACLSQPSIDNSSRKGSGGGGCTPSPPDAAGVGPPLCPPPGERESGVRGWRSMLRSPQRSDACELWAGCACLCSLRSTNSSQGVRGGGCTPSPQTPWTPFPPPPKAAGEGAMISKTCPAARVPCPPSRPCPPRTAAEMPERRRMSRQTDNGEWVGMAPSECRVPSWPLPSSA